MKLLKINKVDISLKQLMDLDASNGDIDRVDNIRNGQILTAYVNPERTDQFRFRYLTDILVAGSGITFTTVNGITTISSTGGGGGGTQGLQDVITQDPVLTADNTIDGGGFTQQFTNNYKFSVSSEQLIALEVNDGTQTAQLELYPQAGYTALNYDNGSSGTQIKMTGANMYINTPNYASKTNGDVLTLIDNFTGEVEFQTPTTTTGDSLSPLLLMGG
jgi:hypothetical protein